MQHYPKIKPADAAARGLKPIKAQRVGQTKNQRDMTADAERYAAAMGMRIVGKWDEEPVQRRTEDHAFETVHNRTYWCE